MIKYIIDYKRFRLIFNTTSNFRNYIKKNYLAKYLSASNAAIQPVPAAVTA